MTNKSNPCYLYSKANYALTIKYDGKNLIIPPHATKFLLPDETKLGELPEKVRKVTIRKES